MDNQVPTSVPAEAVPERAYEIRQMHFLWGSSHWQNRATRVYLEGTDLIDLLTASRVPMLTFPKYLIIKEFPKDSEMVPESFVLPWNGKEFRLFTIGKKEPFFELQIHHRHQDTQYSSLLGESGINLPENPVVIERMQLKQGKLFLTVSTAKKFKVQNLFLSGALRIGKYLYVAENIKFPSATRGPQLPSIEVCGSVLRRPGGGYHHPQPQPSPTTLTPLSRAPQGIVEDATPMPEPNSKRRKLVTPEMLEDSQIQLDLWPDFEAEMKLTKQGVDFLAQLQKMFERSSGIEGDTLEEQRFAFVTWLDALLLKGLFSSRSQAALVMLSDAVTQPWLYGCIQHKYCKRFLTPFPVSHPALKVTKSAFLVRFSNSRMPYLALNATFYDQSSQSVQDYSAHILFKSNGPKAVRFFLETEKDAGPSESDTLSEVIQYLVNTTGWKPADPPFTIRQFEEAASPVDDKTANDDAPPPPTPAAATSSEPEKLTLPPITAFGAAPPFFPFMSSQSLTQPPSL